jgi:hypothetical protein
MTRNVGHSPAAAIIAILKPRQHLDLSVSINIAFARSPGGDQAFSLPTDSRDSAHSVVGDRAARSVLTLAAARMRFLPVPVTA